MFKTFGKICNALALPNFDNIRYKKWISFILQLHLSWGNQIFWLFIWRISRTYIRRKSIRKSTKYFRWVRIRYRVHSGRCIRFGISWTFDFDITSNLKSLTWKKVSRYKFWLVDRVAFIEHLRCFYEMFSSVLKFQIARKGRPIKYNWFKSESTLNFQSTEPTFW